MIKMFSPGKSPTFPGLFCGNLDLCPKGSVRFHGIGLGSDFEEAICQGDEKTRKKNNGYRSTGKQRVHLQKYLLSHMAGTRRIFSLMCNFFGILVPYHEGIDQQLTGLFVFISKNLSKMLP